MNRSLLANVAACCAALCAGTSVVVTRFAVGEIDPVTLAFYRYAIAMICLLPVLPFVSPKARVPAADVITIALLGAVFFGFFSWAFSAALQYTTAARGAIGVATIPNPDPDRCGDFRPREVDVSQSSQRRSGNCRHRDRVRPGVVSRRSVAPLARRTG